MARRQQRRRPASRSSNSLRIIAGQWRGRKLDFPDQEGLRPTTDRVRETVFNWLQAEIEGSRCLDLFSGSGALGLEALSRGAEHATLIDSAPAVVEQLHRNLALLDARNGTVIQSRAQEWLQQSGGERFDLVFLDPPFGQQLLEPCSRLLEQSGCLTERALIYIEAERGLEPLPVPENWRLLKQKNSGQVSSSLWQRQP